MANNVGVVTEQGYPMGGFGFNPISESDQKVIDSNNESKPKEYSNINKNNKSDS